MTNFKLLDLCEMMSKESPFNFPVNREHWSRTLESGVYKIITVERNGEPTGFIIGTISEDHPIFGEVKYAAELAWFVHPDHRDSKVGLELLQAWESFAKLEGCVFIVNAAIHNSSFDKVKYMYEKAGYTQVEVAFIKELN